MELWAQLVTVSKLLDAPTCDVEVFSYEVGQRQ
jgi:hypothetical protein